MTYHWADPDSDYEADTEDEEFHNPEDPDDWSDVDVAAPMAQPIVGVLGELEDEDFEDEHLLPVNAPFVDVPSDCSRSDHDSPTWVDRSFSATSGSNASSDEEIIVPAHENAGLLLIRQIRVNGEEAMDNMNSRLQMELVDRELGYPS